MANLIKYAVGFAMPMVLVRVLSQGDYGTYQQLVLVSNAAIGLMTLGLPTSVYYFYHHVPSSRLPTLVVQTSLMLAFAGILASAAVILFTSPIAAGLSNPDMAKLLSIYALSIGFMIASEHSSSFLIAQDRYALSVALEVGETFLRALVLLAPLLLGFGLTGLVVGIVLYAALRFMVRIGYLFVNSGMKFSGWSKSLFLGDQLGYSVPIALTSLLLLVSNTFNKAILASTFTPKDYAIYAVGDMPIPIATIFQNSVANVLRATLPALVRDGNLEEVVRILRESSRKLSIIVLPSFVFLFGHAYLFVTTLFTASYEESVPVFRIFMLTVPLDMLLLSPLPQIFGRTRIYLYVNLAQSAALIVLSYLLIKGIGFYGAAIAVVVCHFLGVILYILVALRLTQSTLTRLLPLPAMARVTAAALLGHLAAQLVNDLTSFGLMNLALAAGVFTLVFLLSAALGGVFTEDDRNLIRRWIGKVLPVGIR